MTHITLIWYRINAIKEDVQNEFSDYLIIFYDDEQSCVDYIRLRPMDDTIFLISSAPYVLPVLALIHACRQVDSIFVYSVEQEHKIDEYSIDKYSKIIGTFDKLDILFQSIRENIHLSIKQSQSFKFYQQHQKSTRELSKEAGSFLWLRLFKHVVFQLPHDEEAKQDMIGKLKQIYRNNRQQLKLIEKFNQEYKSSEAIRWYTGEPFLYKQLNRALRTEDIELLFTFRYFVSDLSKALLTEYEFLKDVNVLTLTFYRGVKVTKEEAKKLEESVEKLISTNGYFSTSSDEEVALAFTGGTTDTEDTVLFEIEYNIDEINSIIVASIAHYSIHPDEKEVLFDLDAAFEIVSTTRDASSNFLKVKMKATDEGSTLAQEYITQHRRHIDTTSAVLVYGRLLIEIGQYDKAQQHFERLLEHPNGEDLAFTYYYLGVTQYYKGTFEKALQYYEKAYSMLKNAVPSRKGASAFVLNDIGSIFRLRGHYDEALQHHERALEISERHSNPPGMAFSIENIGKIYRIKGEYDRALKYHIRCLRIKEQYLPRQHREIAQILNSIAALFTDKDDLANAEKYHKESLAISEKCLPPEHGSFSSSFNHIATRLANQGKYDKALEYYSRSLKIKEKIFPNGHVDIAKVLAKIGYVYYLKKDYNLAFDYLEKSLTIREKFFNDIIDVSLISALTYFGLVLTIQRKYDDALVYTMRALNIAQTLLPTGHEDLTDCFTNIGILYREMKNYEKAIEYFQKASNNEKENPSKPNLVRLARNFDNIGICLCYQGDDSSGLNYRLKAVRTIESVAPHAQHADWIDTVGNVCCQKNLLDNALECYLISLNIRTECLPVNHVDVAESLMRLGDVYVEKENFQNGQNNEQYKLQARFYYEKALSIYQKYNHVNCIYILNCIGAIYEDIQKYNLAIAYYRRALDASERYSPLDNSIKETNENNIARTKWFMQ